MTRTFTFLFDKWWRPILFWLTALVLVIASEEIKSNILSNVSLLLLTTALLGLISSAIFQLFKNDGSQEYQLVFYSAGQSSLSFCMAFCFSLLKQLTEISG
jgi:hypothetical protein